VGAHATQADVEGALVAVVVALFAIRFHRVCALAVLADIEGAGIAVATACGAVDLLSICWARDRTATADFGQVALVRGRPAHGSAVFKKVDKLTVDALPCAARALLVGARLACGTPAARGNGSQYRPGQPGKHTAA
jgi:hypothetical protein